MNLLKKYKIILNFILVLVFLSVLVTGERSAFFKSTLLFLLIFYFIEERKLILKKFYLLSLTIFFMTIFIFDFSNTLCKTNRIF